MDEWRKGRGNEESKTKRLLHSNIIYIKDNMHDLVMD